MPPKTKEKEQAIILRRRGLSYREILEQIPVAKSSLSLWLHSVGLSKKQKQRLTEKKLVAIKRGWIAAQRKWHLRIQEAEEDAQKEVHGYMNDPLWLIGIVLYWAEGTKIKPWGRRGQRVTLSNTDPLVILLFVQWLHYLHIPQVDLIYSIYIHKDSESRLDEVREYWAALLKISRETIRIYYKKHNIKPRRRNIGSSYYGVMRVDVRRSSALNHKIKVWIHALSKKYCHIAG